MLVLLAFYWDYPGTSIHLSTSIHLRVYLLKFQKTRMRVKPSWFLELHLLGYLVICAGCITCLLNKYTIHLLAFNFCRWWCYFVLLLMKWHVGAIIWISAHTFRNLCLLWFFLLFILVLVLRENNSFLCLLLFLLDITDCYNLDQIIWSRMNRSFMSRGLILMGTWIIRKKY
jgi:hypothetical protein